MGILEWVIASLGTGFLGVNIFLIRLARQKNNGYVKKDICHEAMASLHTRIDTLEKHIDQRFQDLMEYIKK